VEQRGQFDEKRRVLPFSRKVTLEKGLIARLAETAHVRNHALDDALEVGRQDDRPQFPLDDVPRFADRLAVVDVDQQREAELHHDGERHRDPDPPREGQPRNSAPRAPS